MKNTKCLLILLFILSFSSFVSFAQKNTDADSNETYKIYTHTFVGSNDADSGEKLSAQMADAFAEVKNSYKYTNYQLLLTQFQLIKQKGNISYKSILKNSDYADNIDAPMFASWVFQGLDKEELNGRKQIGFRSFRFDMRFPIKNIATNKDKAPTFLYESVNLSAQNLDFPIGEPVLFASLPIDVSDKTLFFVAQVEEIK